MFITTNIKHLFQCSKFIVAFILYSVFQIKFCVKRFIFATVMYNMAEILTSIIIYRKEKEKPTHITLYIYQYVLKLLYKKHHQLHSFLLVQYTLLFLQLKQKS